MKDIPDNSLAVGSPARVVGNMEDYINKNKLLMQTRPVFDATWTMRGNITDEQKKEMIKKLESGIGFVE